MGLFKFLANILSSFVVSDCDYYSDDNYTKCDDNTYDFPNINPSTGLPMVGEVDVAGNPFGANNSDYYNCINSSWDIVDYNSFSNDITDNNCLSDDSWDSFNSFDDSFGNDY